MPEKPATQRMELALTEEHRTCVQGSNLGFQDLKLTPIIRLYATLIVSSPGWSEVGYYCVLISCRYKTKYEHVQKKIQPACLNSCLNYYTAWC